MRRRRDLLRLPRGVIGNTRDFDSLIPGSSPGGVADGGQRAEGFEITQSEKGVVKKGLAPLQRDRFSTGKKGFRCNGACPIFTRGPLTWVVREKGGQAP